ncbi:DUF6385 domain-containing protein [Nakamurella lactea]|uniref:DUF6385 domain-containing protein n=1 Tax=Nakamurella lactea TaxID=459515 RepID=UPI00040DC00B|nr:DUF6385 domain-containing protein [Nakamurella lactea]
MQNTNTSVLARRVRISDDYATLPYEAGWATEAVFFLQTEGDHADLALGVEVSPDGINWLRRSAATLAAADSLIDLPVGQFGNWLRLTVSGASERQPARILIHLNLKG